MKKFLIILVVLIVLIAVVIMGDYFNFPLWPFNFRNRTYQLTIHCTIDDLKETEQATLISKEKGISIDIRDHKQEPLKSLKNLEMLTDDAGVFRVYLTEGTYAIRAEIMTYFKNQVYHFASAELNQYEPFTLNRETNKIDLQLKKLMLTSAASIRIRFNRFIREGNLDAALQLLTESESRKNLALTHEERKTFRSWANTVEQLIMLNAEFSQFNGTQYISQLNLVEQMLSRFALLLPEYEPKRYKIQSKGSILYLSPRKEALSAALTYIWSEYITDINNFISIRNYSKAYEFWLLFMKNSEIYREEFPFTNEKLQQDFEKLKENMPKIQDKLIWRMNNWFEEAIAHYNNNNLEEADELFQKISRITDDFEHELDLEEDFQSELMTYIEDIQYLKLAKQYNEMKDMDRVVEYYNKVHHVSQWLRVRKADLGLPQSGPEVNTTLNN